MAWRRIDGPCQKGPRVGGRSEALRVAGGDNIKEQRASCSSEGRKDVARHGCVGRERMYTQVQEEVSSSARRKRKGRWQAKKGACVGLHLLSTDCFKDSVKKKAEVRLMTRGRTWVTRPLWDSSSIFSENGSVALDAERRGQGVKRSPPPLTWNTSQDSLGSREDTEGTTNSSGVRWPGVCLQVHRLLPPTLPQTRL